MLSFFFFFNDTATTEIYTLSLHDALPISAPAWAITRPPCWGWASWTYGWTRMDGRVISGGTWSWTADRKSTRLNSSHQIISYAVFCLKKKNKTTRAYRIT